jgi:hypothetical protein
VATGAVASGRTRTVGKVALWAGVLVAVVAPAVKCFDYIRYVSVNIPDIDTWSLVPAIRGFVATGHLSWHTLWTPDLEDRPVLWRLFLLLYARLTTFDIRFITTLCVVFLVCEVVACAYALRIQNRLVRAAVAIPISWLVFDLGNWETITREWAVANAAAVALSMLAVILAARLPPASSWPRRTLSVVAVCIVASLTAEPGLLSWFACIVILLYRPQRERLYAAAAFTVATIVFLIVYRSGLPPSTTSFDLHHLGQTMKVGVVSLGDGLIGAYYQPYATVQFVVGLIELGVVATALGLTFRYRLREDPLAARMSLGIMLLGLFGAASIAFGRTINGVGAAGVARYTVITAPAAVGCYLMLVQIARTAGARLPAIMRKPLRLPRQTVVLAALAGAVGVGLIGAAIANDHKEDIIAPFRREYEHQMLSAGCHFRTASDAQLSMFEYTLTAHPYQSLRRDLADLSSVHLSAFASRGCSG